MTDLLPPNATRFERALSNAVARAAAIDHPIATLIDPMGIEARWLPWLAWAFSVDRWDADWSEARKRQAVAEAIPAHRRKGTPASVDAVLADYDRLLRLVEWHEVAPRAIPHTFDIILPLGADGGDRATARFAEAVARDVDQVKPARSHGTLIQQVATTGLGGVVGAVATAGLARVGGDDQYDPDAFWDRLLQTEDGEPLTDDTREFLEA